MTTGRTIITRALQIAGIATKNESPSADEMADALVSLNDMLASWANDTLLVYARTWEDFTLSGGVSSYTIGASGTFNTVRPAQIIEAHTKDANIKYNELAIVSDSEYNIRISNYNLSGFPEYLNFDNAFPLATIRLYPTPSTALTLSILSEKPITALTLDGTVTLPSGWDRALKFNLAQEISGEYGQKLDPMSMKIANDSLTSIKKQVTRSTPMDYPSGGGAFNIYKGY